MNLKANSNFKKCIVIGLTGGIACGKSIAANCFVKNGAVLIDADLIAKEILNTNTDAYKKVVKYFGAEILNKDGFINRGMLLSRVLKNKKNVEALNKISHPFIINEILNKIKQLKTAAVKLIVIDAPLLFETGLNNNVNFTVVVSSKLSVRINRVKKDGKISLTAFNKFRKLQMSLKEKCKRADFVLLNNGSKLHLESKIFSLLSNLLVKCNV